MRLVDGARNVSPDEPKVNAENQLPASNLTSRTASRTV